MTKPFIHRITFAMAALLLLPGLSGEAVAAGAAADAASGALRADRQSGRPGSVARATGAGLRNLPLLFEPVGAAGDAEAGDPAVAAPLFAARGEGYELRLHGPAAEFLVGGKSLRLSFAEANQAATPQLLDPQATRVSYFIGTDPAQWRAGSPAFGRVRYRDIYPGIDVEFYGLRNRPEFDLIVHPGADPSRIRLQIDGADSIEQGAAEELLAEAGGLPIYLRIPRIYQPGGRAGQIQGGFRRRPDGSFVFALGKHDPALPLIIDPVLVFSTLLGGAFGDNAYDVALDPQGNIYVAGLTHEMGFLQTPGAFASPGGSRLHIFVAKLNPDGTELLYAAVIGGGAEEQGRAIAVDAAGNVYLTGITFSPDFPVTGNALQPNFAGGNTDAYLVKLSADGSTLLYSSYLGGSRQEFGEGIAVTADGSVFVAGSTLADDFPVLPNALQPVTNSDAYDAFLVKMDVDTPALLAATFFGGSDRDEILDLALDPAGNVVITGVTISKDFPATSGVFQPEHRGVTTAFVSKLTPDLSEIVFSTYLGGSTEDRGQTVAVDPAGDIYVGGRTLSTDFPVTPEALQGGFARGSFFGDGFVAKLSADGSRLIYATYLGGSSEDEVNGITVDGTGQATVAGGTGSNDFKLTSNAVQRSIAGFDDVFVTRLSADGTRAVYSTLLGGEKSDRALGIASAGPGSVVVAGTTVSPDFPTTSGVVQTEIRGAEAGGDDLVIRLDQLFTPGFSANAIVNAASLQRGPVAPGEIVTIFGENLGPPNPAFAELTGDGLLSSQLGETRVLFDGVAAPLVFAADGQISAVVPYAVAGSASVEVQVEFFGVVSAPVSVAVIPASPALFTVNSQGWGPAAALNQDYRLNSAQNPAERGSIVLLFATGEGMTDQAADGVLAMPPLARPLLPITVTVGGRPAEVLYAGAAPGLVAGVMQINARIPADAPTGDGVMVVVDAGEIAGARWVTLAIR